MPSKNITTPKGTARYPKLDKPDTKFKPEGEYTCDLILSAEEAQPLIDQVTKLREDFYRETLVKEKKKVLKKADLTFFKAETDDEGNETGRVILKFKAKAAYKRDEKLIPVGPIPRFDAKGRPTKADVWSGSQIKVAFEPNCWFTPALGVGISLRLKAVQVIELVTAGARDAKGYGFGTEDGYEATETVREETTDAQPETDATDSGDF